MAALELLAAGRTADVFALDRRRVLRRYRDGHDASGEASVMAYLGGLGFPVPEVDDVAGSDLVMERLYGPTMSEAMLGQKHDVEYGARLLADLHTRLHALPARLSADPGDRILHLDLHPENVVLSSRGAVVIDWANAAEGPPDLDVALSALIFAEVAVDESRGVAALAATALRAFLGSAAGEPARMLDRALAMRAGNLTLSPEEVARLPLAVALVTADR